MIITLKSIQNGFFKVQIKPAIGEKYFREFTAEALHEYLQAVDFYCEVKGYPFRFIIPDAFKKACRQWIESLAKRG